MPIWREHNATILLFLFLCFHLPLASQETPSGLSQKETEAKKKQIESLQNRIRYSNSSDRLAAIRRVKSLDEGEADTFFPLCREMIREDLDWQVRRGCIRMLADLKVTDAEPSLIAALEDKRLDVQRASVEGLRKIGSAAAGPGLEKLVKAQDFKSNNQLLTIALRTMGHLKIRSALPFLSEKADDEETHPEIRSQIVLYYGASEATDKIDSLLEMAADEDEDPDLRANAVNSIGKLNDKKALAPLKKVLTDMRNIVSSKERARFIRLRLQLLAALVRLGDDSIYPEIFAAAKDNVAGIRMRAIRQIGELKIADAENLLRFKSEHDSNARVRKAAEDALKLLRGEDVADEEDGEEAEDAP